MRSARREPCHVTLKVRRELPSLRLPQIVRAVEATFRKGCDRGAFRLVHYSLQDDHVHLLVEANGAESLGRGMKSIASRFALAVNRALKRHGPVLFDRYHFRVLRTPTEVRNALRYVLLNARKHWAQSLRRRGKDVAKILRASVRPVLDTASSARWFDGWKGEVALDRSPPSPVAKAKTWLLGPGWRLGGGLLDPNEIPGACASDRRGTGPPALRPASASSGSGEAPKRGAASEPCAPAPAPLRLLPLPSLPVGPSGSAPLRLPLTPRAPLAAMRCSSASGTRTIRISVGRIMPRSHA